MKLNAVQREWVLQGWREGRTVAQIAKRRGLLREYVQGYVRYLNAHPEFK